MPLYRCLPCRRPRIYARHQPGTALSATAKLLYAYAECTVPRLLITLVACYYMASNTARNVNGW